MENLDENIESNVGLMEREESTMSSVLSFQIEKEILLNGLKIVERATAQKGLQPVLANILIEAESKTKLN